MSTSLRQLLAMLYRRRWPISFVLITVSVLVPDGRPSLVGIVLGVLVLLLLWLPLVVRWTQALSEAGTAFREGLRGE